MICHNCGATQPEEWVPVEERLPPVKTDVLVTINTGGLYVASVGANGRWFWSPEDRPVQTKLLAWRPMPAPYSPSTKEGVKT